jgi:hypothetical protein
MPVPPPASRGTFRRPRLPTQVVGGAGKGDGHRPTEKVGEASSEANERSEA